jgi:hypothetical protein
MLTTIFDCTTILNPSKEHRVVCNFKSTKIYLVVKEFLCTKGLFSLTFSTTNLPTNASQAPSSEHNLITASRITTNYQVTIYR